MTQAASSFPRRFKIVTILLGLAFAGVALMSWSQTWFIVELTGDVASHAPLSVGGDVGAPALSALALAGAAGLGALTISGRFFRVLLGALEAIVGACIVLSASLALATPVSTVAPTVTHATSVEGAGPVAALVDSAAATAWPFVALLAGIFLAAVGVAVVVAGKHWPVASRRYEPVRLERTDSSPIADWDDLSAGSDPTAR